MTTGPLPPERAPDVEVTHRLEASLLGTAASLTSDQVADSGGIELAWTRRLWRALGFPQAEAGVIAYTEADVEALQLARHLVDAGLVDYKGAETFARVLGRGLYHLAEAQVGLLADYLAEPDVQARVRDDGAETSTSGALVHELDRLEAELAGLEQLMVYTWRRHLVAALQRTVTATDPEFAGAPVAVGFADIVNYTRLTRDMSPDELDDLVDDFEKGAYDAVVGSGARVVKTLGDEVMFVTERAQTAAEVGLSLAEAFADRTGTVPPVRVGLAWGSALARGGDVFGPVVNVASRCCSLARPGAVLVDRELARALGDDPRWDLHLLRPRAVRGYGHLSTAALRRGGSPARPKPKVKKSSGQAGGLPSEDDGPSGSPRPDR